MHDLVFQIISIIIGGAVLGIGGFMLTLLWNFRKEWILHQAWQETAQETLVEQGKNIKDLVYKFGGLDGRITKIEHPVYPLRRGKRIQVEADN